MISRLRGEGVTRSPTGVVLDVAGVGYLVNPTDSARRQAEPGKEVVLETYLHVREDALQLFGFAEAAERELFELPLCAQGAGPQGALAIVSGSSPNELRRAIALEDTARFQAIPGIGKKTAERVVLELKERLGAAGGEGRGLARSGRRRRRPRLRRRRIWSPVTRSSNLATPSRRRRRRLPV